MKEKMLEIIKNKDYLPELLSKNTLGELVEFCKSKGVEITTDDAKEFVGLIQSLRSEAEKCKSSKEKLNDNELVDKVVGGYAYEDEERYNKAMLREAVRTALIAVGGACAIATGTIGAMYLIHKDAVQNNIDGF